MEDLKEAQLLALLRGLMARVQSLEGAVNQALGKSNAADANTWDLFAQLVEHDHCELCGRAVWGGDHTC